MDFFRVFPWVSTASPGEPGHALYLPPIQGSGRVDNPEHYRVLYVCDAPAGAVAEAFGNHALWTDALLHRPSVAGSRMALATLRAETIEVLDLDDAAALLARSLRPSHVITRDRATSRRWSLAIFGEARWAGVRWWSYYESRWGAIGLWDVSALEVAGITSLDRHHPAVAEAAAVLSREWR